MASTYSLLRIFLLAVAVAHVRAQNCYYPNGDVAQGMAPCNSNGGMCCPLNWQCMDNGLCYLDNAKYLGRYTCTDRSWGSSCPNFCTGNPPGSATGNEAVLQCQNGQYCCDGDRSFDCCSTPNTNFFNLAQGNIFASISSIGAPTSVPSSRTDPPATSQSPSSMQQSTTDAPSSSATSAAASSSPSRTSNTSQTTTRVSTFSSVVTNSAGVSTIVSYVTVSPTSDPTVGAAAANTGGGSSMGKGAIIGLAIGIPLGTIFLAVVAFLLWKRRRDAKRNAPLSPGQDEAPMFGAYEKSSTDHSKPPELDGHAVPAAYGTPSLNGRAELPSEGTNSADPSPYMSQNGWSPNPNNRWSAQSGVSTLGGGHQHTNSAGYQPYRPGQPPISELEG